VQAGDEFEDGLDRVIRIAVNGVRNLIRMDKNR
jgi:hypothetical protein